MQPAILSLTLLTVGASAQTFFIPDAIANSGACNTFPLGGTGNQNLKYQQLITATELLNIPGNITGLGFAQCGAGSHHYDTIEIRLDHTTLTTLSAGFNQNITTNAMTVLSASNYDWHLNANSWEEVGLQQYFPYNGIDNLIVEITVTHSQWTANGLGSAGMRAGTHQRLYATNWANPPATGTLTGTFALKIEVDMGTPKLSSYGRGCVGANNLPPVSGATGAPHLGLPLTLTLADGPSSTLAVRMLGFNNSAPYPLDLTAFGLPTCLLYFNPAELTPHLTDPTGAAAATLVVPADLALFGALAYSQWACYEPSVNAFGFSTSNYVRLVVGI